MFSNGTKHSFALVGSNSGYIVKYGGFSAPSSSSTSLYSSPRLSHTQLTLGALKLNEHHNGLQRKVVAIGAESKSTASPSSVQLRCDLLHDWSVHQMTV